jgi:hypothetical protein
MALMTEGVDLHRISGENIPITCPARTVADSFKHRSQIGLEPCLEALREVLRSKRGIISEIHYFAKLNRVAKVMQPATLSGGHGIRELKVMTFHYSVIKKRTDVFYRN